MLDKEMDINTLKRNCITALKTFFGEDIRRINHALAVLKFAEKILETESGNPRIVLPAAIFHDVGIKIAEEKYGSTAGRYQEKEGPPVAEKILTDLDLPAEDITEICEIIAHHHSPGIVKTANFQVLYEADWLVNLGDDFADHSREKKRVLIEKNFKTAAGMKLAQELYQ